MEQNLEERVTQLERRVLAIVRKLDDLQAESLREDEWDAVIEYFLEKGDEYGNK